MEKFRRERIPILLGTQMVAKGLDFENVTLVGAVSADQLLYTGGIYAGERAFSLLTQVAGRAGRGEKPGEAVIQTFTPDNDVIRFAACQDYDSFYEQEIQLRRARGCPPFRDMLVFTASGMSEAAVLRSCARLRRALESQLRSMGRSFQLLGPAPAAVPTVNDRFRHRLTVWHKNDPLLRRLAAHLLRAASQDKENRGVSIYADFNPF